MNIIIKLSDVLDEDNNLNNSRIHFLNPKRNITMDGEFTKILFVTEQISTDSLFIEFPVKIQYDNRFITSDNFKKNVSIKNNLANQPIINKCIELEKQLLNHYKQYKNINKIPNLLLHNNLSNGHIKFFSSNKNNNKPPILDNNKIHGIKISGIWESYDSIGITYKITEFTPLL